MISTSEKMTGKVSAEQNLAKLKANAPVLRKHRKLKLKGADKTRLKKIAAKRTAVLNKRANPKALKLSRQKVSAALKKLGLVSAGFGRYHKGKGKPITHWVMRNPKTGLYILANKELRAKLLGRKATAKPTGHGQTPSPAPIKKVGRPSNARKAFEAKKELLTKLHLERLDKKRAERLAKKGKPIDKPLTATEQKRRAASVRHLHRVLERQFRRQQEAQKIRKAAPGKPNQTHSA